jgi:ribonuclease T2
VGIRFERRAGVNSQRLRQTVIGVLILVAIAMFWNRGETTTDTAAPETARIGEAAPASPAPAVEATAPAARADAAFDYYVLVLSWSPTHCSSEQGRGRDDDLQCRSGRPYGFVLHGLWPQHERGYPEDCPTDEPRTVGGDLMRDMLEISPSAQLVQHEWRKHGTCAGLSQADYFAAASKAFRSVVIPPAYQAPKRVVTTTPDDVRDAFLSANTNFKRDAVSATCRRNDLAEVWVCLDRSFAPRACSKDVRNRHCGGREVRLRAVRGDWPR